jgi:hypothetical protein
MAHTDNELVNTKLLHRVGRCRFLVGLYIHKVILAPVRVREMDFDTEPFVFEAGVSLSLWNFRNSVDSDDGI